ncbi:MAG: hypothetical protein QF554_05460 [Dehalococcoidia bacterium]|jgi:hypothetical protein|nr:hypothetical protein [Dehalococcoidia bacterium]
MKKMLLFVGILAIALFSVAFGSGTASAAKPDNPGCFGTDRANNNNTWVRDLGPGSSWWGHEAANRASDNGPQNQAYKAWCGG